MPSTIPLALRDAQRLFAALVPGGHVADDGGPPLEASVPSTEPTRLVASEVIEGTTLRARRIVEPPVAGFGAFLDGTQRSRVVCYHAGLPIVFGTTAAVVRVRVNRRMRTWARGPKVARRLYLPRAYLPAALWDRAAEAGFDPVDTTRREGGREAPHAHPFELLRCAVHAVQQDREALEQELAEEWCRAADAPLYIDGGVSKSEKVATSRCTVSVVKSHRTMYVDDALPIVLELPAGWRTSVFAVTHAGDWLSPVASWYLRLRDPAGHDPMWGLVRVEIALPAPDERGPALAERADLVSRWVLAEGSPLAMPDARWDKMAYGIRDCEEFLRAVV